MAKSKKISDVPIMNDEELAKFWDSNEPEDFEGWKGGELRFTRPPQNLSSSDWTLEMSELLTGNPNARALTGLNWFDPG